MVRNASDLRELESHHHRLLMKLCGDKPVDRGRDAGMWLDLTSSGGKSLHAFASEELNRWIKPYAKSLVVNNARTLNFQVLLHQLTVDLRAIVATCLHEEDNADAPSPSSSRGPASPLSASGLLHHYVYASNLVHLTHLLVLQIYQLAPLAHSGSFFARPSSSDPATPALPQQQQSENAGRLDHAASALDDLVFVLVDTLCVTGHEGVYRLQLECARLVMALASSQVFYHNEEEEQNQHQQNQQSLCVDVMESLPPVKRANLIAALVDNAIRPSAQPSPQQPGAAGASSVAQSSSVSQAIYGASRKVLSSVVPSWILPRSDPSSSVTGAVSSSVSASVDPLEDELGRVSGLLLLSLLFPSHGCCPNPWKPVIAEAKDRITARNVRSNRVASVSHEQDGNGNGNGVQIHVNYHHLLHSLSRFMRLGGKAKTPTKKPSSAAASSSSPSVLQMDHGHLLLYCFLFWNPSFLGYCVDPGTASQDPLVLFEPIAVVLCKGRYHGKVVCLLMLSLLVKDKGFCKALQSASKSKKKLGRKCASAIGGIGGIGGLGSVPLGLDDAMWLVLLKVFRHNAMFAREAFIENCCLGIFRSLIDHGIPVAPRAAQVMFTVLEQMAAAYRRSYARFHHLGDAMTSLVNRVIAPALQRGDALQGNVSLLYSALYNAKLVHKLGDMTMGAHAAKGTAAATGDQSQVKGGGAVPNTSKMDCGVRYLCALVTHFEAKVEEFARPGMEAPDVQNMLKDHLDSWVSIHEGESAVVDTSPADAFPGSAVFFASYVWLLVSRCNALCFDVTKQSLFFVDDRDDEDLLDGTGGPAAAAQDIELVDLNQDTKGLDIL